MEILYVIVGALAGVVADLLFRQNILRFFLRVKRMLARLAKRADPLAGKPRQLRFGNVVTEWISIHGTGELPIRSQHLRAELIDDFIALPADLDALRAETRRKLEQKRDDGKSDVWNGQRFSLVRFYPTRYGTQEEYGMNFEFKLTDYAAHIGISRRVDDPGLVKDSANNPTTIRDKYFPDFDPESPNKYLTHSFGINLLVITRDSKVLLVQRSPFLAQRKLFYNISVNEGMQYPQDMDEFGRPSFMKAAIRGLWEELGIEFESLGLHNKSIEFLNFGALAHTNEYGLLGRIKLPLKAIEVEELRNVRAKDADLEIIGELFAVDYLPDAILEFVNTHSPWAQNGLANLYYGMVREWGYWEVKSAFSRHTVKKHICQDDGWDGSRKIE